MIYFDPFARIFAFIFNVWASARQDGTYAKKNKEKKLKSSLQYVQGAYFSRIRIRI